MKTQSVKRPELLLYKGQRPAGVGWRDRDEEFLRVEVFEDLLLRFSGHPNLDYVDSVPTEDDDVLVEMGTSDRSPISPLDDPDLWLKFAKFDPSKKEILRLCEMHGFLFKDLNMEDFQDVLIQVCERYYDWSAEMSALYIAKLVYFGLKNGEPTEAIDFICGLVSNEWWTKKYGNAYSEYALSFYTSQFRSMAHNFDRYDKWDSQSTVEKLMAFLREMINNRTKYAHIQSVESESGLTLSLHICPVNLHTAIWLQFAQVVSRGTTFHRCIECGREFSNTGYYKHQSKALCSNACKQARHRQQRKGGKDHSP